MGKLNGENNMHSRVKKHYFFLPYSKKKLSPYLFHA